VNKLVKIILARIFYQIVKINELANFKQSEDGQLHPLANVLRSIFYNSITQFIIFLKFANKQILDKFDI